MWFNTPHLGAEINIFACKFHLIPRSLLRGYSLKTNTGAYHELYLQTINLEKDRSVTIITPEIGEPKDTLWVALVLFMKEMEPVLYLIPSKTLTEPDDYIFIENDQGDRFKHLSNWEIKVFTKAIPQLSKYAFANMIKEIS